MLVNTSCLALGKLFYVDKCSWIAVSAEERSMKEFGKEGAFSFGHCAQYGGQGDWFSEK